MRGPLIRLIRAAGVALALSVAGPALAVQPDGILSDPALESRAREISRQIRCPVCQGESIDDSNAPISRDLRLIIRNRLQAGDSDAAVIDFVVARYGEFVLFNPRAEGVNLVLWLAGPVLLVLAIGGVLLLRRGANAGGDTGGAPLTPEEESRLAEILSGTPPHADPPPETPAARDAT